MVSVIKPIVWAVQLKLVAHTVEIAGGAASSI